MDINKNDFIDLFKLNKLSESQINKLYKKYINKDDSFKKQVYNEYLNDNKNVKKKSFYKNGKSRTFILYEDENSFNNMNNQPFGTTNSEPRYAAQKIYTKLCKGLSGKCYKEFKIMEILINSNGDKIPGKIFNYKGIRKEIQHKEVTFGKNKITFKYRPYINAL
tara:strand:- start:408 stop:899 length:492 start_codon:yes stop_codon:yes gene_type:complete